MVQHVQRRQKMDFVILVFNKGFPKEVSIIKRCVLEVEGGKRVHGLEYILGAAIALDL